MSYYSSTGQSFKHPILGDLQVLQDSTQTQILRCRIDRFHTISESRDLTRDPQTISHPNIIKLNHTTPLKNEYFDCSFEYFSNTLSDEIRTRIRKNARYDEDELIALMKDIGRALCYLQSNRSPYRYINGDTIVKVNSGYKLLHPVLLAGYQNQNEQTVSSINLSQINIPDETNDYYQKAFDSDHERYRRDIYDFGLLILNAMTLSNDVTLTAAQKLKIASSYYSQELVGLVSKMLEKIISLRMDCIACDYFIENLANSSRTADSFSKRRASGTNSNLSGIKYTQNSNLTLDNLSITLDYPRSTSARPERMKKDEEPKNTDEVRSSRTMFREILKTALPTPQNRDAFFADLPSDLSDEAEDLLTKTFSVKTPRAKPEPSTAKFTDLSLETHNKDNSFYSTVETTRKMPYSNSNLSQVLDRRPANSVENIQNDEDYYPRQFEAHSAREDRSEYSQPQKVPVNIKPKARGRVGVDPLTYVAKKRNLQLDDIDSDYTTLESKKEKEQRIQPPSTKSKKIDYFKSPNLHERSPLANISDYSAFDNGVKDHSTDCLTNTPSTNERKSPYGFLTTHSNNIETAKPKQKTFIFGKENNKAYKVNHAHAKKSNGSRGLKRIKNKPLVNNDIRLPSFGDDYGHSESDEYDVNELSDHNEDLLTTPNSTTTLSRKNYFTPNETVSPNRPRSPTPIRFITEVYPDGSVYQGEGYHNLRHGIGRLVFRDGSSYEGEWNQDNIEGFGVFFAPNGTIAYEGEWQNNKCNGQGVHYNEKSRKITAVDLENLPRKKEGHWKRYEGGFCNDKWEGEGKLVFSNGDEYCGDFVSDLIHGFGKYITREGVVYEGEWANNQLIKLAHAYNSFDGQE